MYVCMYICIYLFNPLSDHAQIDAEEIADINDALILSFRAHNLDKKVSRANPYQGDSVGMSCTA